MTSRFLALTSTCLFSAALLAAGTSSPAHAATAAVEDGDDETSQASTEEEEPWIRRWRPRHLMSEIGVFGGIVHLEQDNQLFDPRPELGVDQGWKPFRRTNATFGLRYAFLPASFFGIELEGALMPGRIAGKGWGEDRVMLWRAGGHFIFQISAASIVPFAVVGGGFLGVASEPGAIDPNTNILNLGGVGNDVDGSLHFGGGVKFYINKYFMLRVDARDILAIRKGENVNLLQVVQGQVPEYAQAQFSAHNLEVTLGVSITLGRPKPPPPAPPPAPKDTDGDGILDPDDACVYDPETFNEFQDEDGCPESDRDGDGFWDDPDEDACPDEPGVEPDGCPIRDTDGDGILDPDDECVEEPETRNGFEDADGCPDELPEEVTEFMGVIEGIHFEYNSDAIKPDSEVVLNRAVDILSKYDQIQIEISGHTDNKGGDAYNLELSGRRAASVRAYLIANGIDGSRITTRGAGFHEPIADNATRSGRAMNRRIEFQVLSQ